MHSHTYSKSKDQPGEAANAPRGQLNREIEYFPVPVRALEFGLARRFRQSVPSRVSLLIPIILRLNMVLTHGVPPEFRCGVHFYLGCHAPSGQSRVYGPRNCVPMAFTAESPPAQGQYTSR